MQQPEIAARAPASDSEAQAKLAALRLTKLVAAAALALCVAVFVAAKSLEGRHPWLGFVAPFVGGVIVGRFLLDYVSRHGYALFGWWRIAVGGVGLIALLMLG